ncbi:MAG TPA: bifunctional precorrin-2 dehydrogenase/sirohydrochlorin ferrochelatase [Ilumatobacteraceae bacterium]|nr:bifunctional precorrin-2 dehydrogenase/sirohydrochlorin ferrochelatase [Ilumatobacteraceae bacterium]
MDESSVVQPPELRSPQFGYPVILDLHDVAVLVVGGGRIGARKAQGLAAAGANVRMVAREVSEHVAGVGVAEVRARAFEPADLDGIRLVVTATGDAEVDAAVSAVARERGIWTNAADQPIDCEFILPAVARVGRVTVAVSTDGASPALARELRNVIAELLTDELGALAEELAAERLAVQQGGESTEDIDWTARVRAGIAAAIGARSLAP